MQAVDLKTFTDEKMVPKRVLGKTGEIVPILGLGTAPAGMGLEDAAAIELFHAAVDRGVTYLDTAPGYGRAQKQLGQMLTERRDEVFVVTKVLTSSAAKALEILQESLKDLAVDQVDLTYVHDVGGLDTDEVLSANGALEGLREAQRRGWTRYLGFSAHNRPHKAARILREAEVDVVMLGMNYADRYTYNFEELVLPLVVERNVGVAAMKVYGGAESMNYETGPTESKRKSALAAHGPHDHQKALRYALGLPGIALAVIGMYNEEELAENLSWVKDYSPLNPLDLPALDRDGRKIAEAWGPHYGPVKEDT